MLTVILTGGKSRRMGKDKALLEAQGGTMSLMLAERYSSVLGEVVFSVDRPGRFDCGAFPQLPDAFPGKGPMNGLYSAFHATKEELVFLTATDMPCGDPTLAKKLTGCIGGGDICTILRRNGHVEPLFSVYHRRCLSMVETCLNGGTYSLLQLFRSLSVQAVPEESLLEWDVARILTNVNTPLDYRRYRDESNRSLR